MLDRIVVVGAGRTTRLLVERLAHLAPVLVLDTAPEVLEEVRAASANEGGSGAGFGVTARLADGTSRFVLEEARGDPRQSVALVAATGDDRRNVEACRLARELGYGPILGIVADQGGAPGYEAAGARPIIRASIVAQAVEHALRHDGWSIAATVGQGKGELLDFVVLPGSPAIGVPLADLQPDAWRVAIIYRGRGIVIPTGETRIAADDRLLVVGDPAILPSVAEQLRIGAPMFPRRHGKRVAVYLPAGRDRSIEMEAEVLAIKTRATGLVRVYPGAEPATTVLEDEAEGPSELADHQRSKAFEDEALQGAELPAHIAHLRSLRPGVVVAKSVARPLWRRAVGRGGAAATLCNGLHAPVLFPRGAPHYARVVYALIHGVGEMVLADTAIDLARMLSLPLAVVRVALPEYLGTRDPEGDRILGRIERRTRLYGLRAETVALEGNPVHELLRLARPTDLLIAGRRRTTLDSFASPDIALRIAESAACSILVQTFEQP
ncbi:MAG: NAD-binding protein [Polyangiaceae bacterium]|nr:NAD-binding protein [Polyangiaceae bacterium]